MSKGLVTTTGLRQGKAKPNNTPPRPHHLFPPQSAQHHPSRTQRSPLASASCLYGVPLPTSCRNAPSSGRPTALKGSTPVASPDSTRSRAGTESHRRAESRLASSREPDGNFAALLPRKTKSDGVLSCLHSSRSPSGATHSAQGRQHGSSAALPGRGSTGRCSRRARGSLPPLGGTPGAGTASPRSLTTERAVEGPARCLPPPRRGPAARRPHAERGRPGLT